MCMLLGDVHLRLIRFWIQTFLKVKEEVKLYADNVQTKISTLGKMIGQLRPPYNLKPDSSSNKSPVTRVLEHDYFTISFCM